MKSILFYFMAVAGIASLKSLIFSDHHDFIVVLCISFRFHACNNEVRGFS